MLNFRFVAAVLLVVCAVGLCLGGSFLSRKAAKELLSVVEKIQTAPVGELDKAVLQLETKWEKHKKMLSVVQNRAVCEQLNGLIVQICAAQQAGQTDEVLLAGLQLSSCLQELLEEEKIDLCNLF